jgi:FkbM family methyltransferase
MNSILRIKERLRDVFIFLIPALARRRYFAALDTVTREDFATRRIEPELALLPFVLDPQKSFFDVGAHTGAYSYVALRTLPAQNIFAFEPQKHLSRRLRRLLPHISVQRCALSSRSGEAWLFIPYKHGTLRSTRATLGELGESDFEKEMVPLKTLDAMKQELTAPPIGCIKIDTEGHELSVLEGATKTLIEDRPVLIVEIEPQHHRAAPEEVFKWLLERGYTPYFIDATSGKLTVRAPGYYPAGISNFIFLPPKLFLSHNAQQLFDRTGAIF